MNEILLTHVNKCQDIYDSAIVTNLQLRMMLAEQLSSMPVHQYMINFGTVSISLGRTTGIAALKYGCFFDGVELDETNVNISISRIVTQTTTKMNEFLA